MKRILLFALVAFASCTRQGEVKHGPITVKVHGKEYVMTNVVPCDGCNPIWFMYPKDSLQEMPFVINEEVRQGKTTVNQATVEVP